jgi:hypothetical protein
MNDETHMIVAVTCGGGDPAANNIPIRLHLEGEKMHQDIFEGGVR